MRISKRWLHGIRSLNAKIHNVKFDRNTQSYRSWIDHPGKVALYGALIVLVGQLGATIFPIIFGPDLSDYNLVNEPIYQEIIPPHGTEHFFSYTTTIDKKTKIIKMQEVNTSVPSPYFITNESGLLFDLQQNYHDFYAFRISLENIHPLQTYSRQVFLTAACPPGFRVSLSNPIIALDQPTTLKIDVNLTYLLLQNSNLWGEENIFPIAVYGIGADGKKRNCTIILRTQILNKLVSLNGTINPKYPTIFYRGIDGYLIS